MIFGDEATTRDFLNFAVENSKASNGIELSSAVASIRDDEVSYLPETFLGGQQVIDEADEENAPMGFNDPSVPINRSQAPRPAEKEEKL